MNTNENGSEPHDQDDPLESDEVTLAASGDVVAQIRAHAAKLRSESDTPEASSGGDDEVTSPNVLRSVAAEPTAPPPEFTSPRSTEVQHDSWTPAAEQAPDMHQPAADQVPDTPQPAVGHASDPHRPAADQASDTHQPAVEEASDSLQPAVEEASDRLQRSATQVPDALRPAVEEAADAHRPAVEEASDAHRPAAAQAAPGPSSTGSLIDGKPVPVSGLEFWEPDQALSGAGTSFSSRQRSAWRLPLWVWVVVVAALIVVASVGIAVVVATAGSTS